MADVNPYASPSVPDPLLPDRPPAGGAWRDGQMLVVHRQGAALPHICLLTSQPAAVRRWVSIRWSYPIDYSMRETAIEVALSTAANQSNQRRSIAGGWAILLSAAGAVTLIFAKIYVPDLPFDWLLLPVAVVGATGLVVAHYSRLLRFQKARGDYLWLHGAHQQFLEHLPTWPGAK